MLIFTSLTLKSPREVLPLPLYFLVSRKETLLFSRDTVGRESVSPTQLVFPLLGGLCLADGLAWPLQGHLEELSITSARVILSVSF